MAKEVTPNKENKSRFRHPALYIFSVLLLVIIVVTFIGAPVISGAAGSSRLIFGEYANRPIEYVAGNYLSQQKDLLAEQLRANAEESTIQFQVYNIWRGAFNNTVFHTAALHTGEESGIVVSDDSLDEALIQNPSYLENGEFSESKYNATSNADKYVIRNLQRDQMVSQQVVSDKVLGIKIVPEEVDFIKQMAKTERKIQFTVFSYAAYPESEVIKFGESNSDRFRTIQLSSITITSSAKDAEQIRTKLDEPGANFEELAKTHSKDSFAENGGERGILTYSDLEGVFKEPGDIETVFSLAKGKISDVLETQSGWIIYKCNEAALKQDLSNPETIDSVRSYMEGFERGIIEDYTMESAEAFVAAVNESSFVEAAGSMELPVYMSDFFPINYGNSSILKTVKSEEYAELQNAAFEEDFFRAVFSAELSTVAEPIVLGDSILVILPVEEQTVEEDENSFLEQYYPYIAQQFQQTDIQESLIDDELLVDNFNQVFTKYFLSNSDQ